MAAILYGDISTLDYYWEEEGKETHQGGTISCCLLIIKGQDIPSVLMHTVFACLAFWQMPLESDVFQTVGVGRNSHQLFEAAVSRWPPLCQGGIPGRGWAMP